MENLNNAGKTAVGLKQTLKAIDKGLARTVYVAKDAEEKIRRPVLDLCQELGIPVYEVETMAELGSISGIQVGAAVAAALKV